MDLAREQRITIDHMAQMKDKAIVMSRRTMSARIKMVSSNYFEVMRMAPTRGRLSGLSADGDLLDAVASARFAQLFGFGDWSCCDVIRMSLGAAPARLQAVALWNALIPVAAGVAGGLVSALWLSSVARTVESTSEIIAVVNKTAPPVTPTGLAVAASALRLAAVACWLPTRRIASVDPAALMKA